MLVYPLCESDSTFAEKRSNSLPRHLCPRLCYFIICHYSIADGCPTNDVLFFIFQARSLRDCEMVKVDLQSSDWHASRLRSSNLQI